MRYFPLAVDLKESYPPLNGGKTIDQVVREVRYCIPKITGSNHKPSGGSVLTFRFDLLLTARGSST
jgi:hypothetical protein